MSFRFGGMLAVGGLLLAALPALAHHAVQSQFDFEKPVEVTGILTKVEWINPHAYLHFDVKDATGKVRTWDFETIGPAGLRKAGFSREGGFTVGDSYKVRGFAAKDGTDLAFATGVIFKDGRNVTIWFGDPNAK